MNELMSNKAECRTAPVTPGLLIILHIVYQGFCPDALDKASQKISFVRMLLQNRKFKCSAILEHLSHKGGGEVGEDTTIRRGC